MSVPLLDTHIWVWWVDGSSQLERPIRVRLDQLGEEQRPRISAISLWEVATLVTLGRLELGVSLSEWFTRAAAPGTVEILPVTPAVAVEVAQLPDDFHRDPADRVIVATARVHQLEVATADRAIRNSKLVRVWKP